MEQNTYRFVWTDKLGKIQHKYLDNSSKDEAITDFEEEFKVSVVDDKVRVTRVRP